MKTLSTTILILSLFLFLSCGKKENQPSKPKVDIEKGQRELDQLSECSKDELKDDCDNDGDGILNKEDDNPYIAKSPNLNNIIYQQSETAKLDLILDADKRFLLSKLNKSASYKDIIELKKRILFYHLPNDPKLKLIPQAPIKSIQIDLFKGNTPLVKNLPIEGPYSIPSFITEDNALKSLRIYLNSFELENDSSNKNYQVLINKILEKSYQLTYINPEGVQTFYFSESITPREGFENLGKDALAYNIEDGLNRLHNVNYNILKNDSELVKMFNSQAQSLDTSFAPGTHLVLFQFQKKDLYESKTPQLKFHFKSKGSKEFSIRNSKHFKINPVGSFVIFQQIHLKGKKRVNLSVCRQHTYKVNEKKILINSDNFFRYFNIILNGKKMNKLEFKLNPKDNYKFKIIPSKEFSKPRLKKGIQFTRCAFFNKKDKKHFKNNFKEVTKQNYSNLDLKINSIQEVRQ